MQRWTRTPLAIAAAAVLVGSLAGARSAQAQVTATASAAATATIVGIAPLTATTLNDLDFGSVTAGTPTTVAEADGARFLITGEPTFTVTLTFGLPTTLDEPGGATIPITFGTADGILWTTFPTTFTTFNPNAVSTPSIDGVGNLEIGVIGTVSPPFSAVSGVYTNTITVTVEY